MDWSTALKGFIPSKTLFAGDALYSCKFIQYQGHDTLTNFHPLPAVGILGATVMPHSLFLGSVLATPCEPRKDIDEEKCQDKLASTPLSRIHNVLLLEIPPYNCTPKPNVLIVRQEIRYFISKTSDTRRVRLITKRGLYLLYFCIPIDSVRC